MASCRMLPQWSVYCKGLNSGTRCADHLIPSFPTKDGCHRRRVTPCVSLGVSACLMKACFNGLDLLSDFFLLRPRALLHIVVKYKSGCYQKPACTVWLSECSCFYVCQWVLPDQCACIGPIDCLHYHDATATETSRSCCPSITKLDYQVVYTDLA